MFVTKGDDSVHGQHQALREFGVLYPSDEVEESNFGSHRNLDLQRLATLMFVVTQSFQPR